MPPGEADPELSAAARAVLAKAAGGEMLTVEDRALLRGEAAVPDSAGVEGSGGAEAFSLAGDAGPAPRWPYARRCCDYAEVYRTDVRNIKKWLERGRAVQPADLPPFDEPEKMPGWWGRRMKHRVPDKILVLAREAAAAAAPVSDCTNAIGNPAGGDSANRVEVDTGSALTRLRQAERNAHAAYELELKKPSPDPGAEEMRRRAWSNLVDVLRKEETAEAARLKAAGDFLTRTDVVAALREVHGAIKQKLLGFLLDMLPKLRGKTEAEERVIWADEVNAFFTGLQNDDDFTNGLVS